MTPKKKVPKHNRIQEYNNAAKPNSSVGSVADLRKGGRWFDPRLCQYSFQGLMIVIATGFIPLSLLSVVSTMVLWECREWLEKNSVQNAGLKNSKKAG